MSLQNRNWLEWLVVFHLSQYLQLRDGWDATHSWIADLKRVIAHCALHALVTYLKCCLEFCTKLLCYEDVSKQLQVVSFLDVKRFSAEQSFTEKCQLSRPSETCHSNQNWLHKLSHSPREYIRQVSMIPVTSTQTGYQKKLQNPLESILSQNFSIPPSKHALSLSADALWNQYSKSSSMNIF